MLEIYCLCMCAHLMWPEPPADTKRRDSRLEVHGVEQVQGILMTWCIHKYITENKRFTLGKDEDRDGINGDD